MYHYPRSHCSGGSSDLDRVSTYAFNEGVGQRATGNSDAVTVISTFGGSVDVVDGLNSDRV